ncbi:hypothetical protein TYRP_022664 [Tyrophagus putrescentiae]|nr:hypothetical protein TYRP_022664 [Tyrophagus putrescentiae]
MLSRRMLGSSVCRRSTTSAAVSAEVESCRKSGASVTIVRLFTRRKGDIKRSLWSTSEMSPLSSVTEVTALRTSGCSPVHRRQTRGTVRRRYESGSSLKTASRQSSGKEEKFMMGNPFPIYLLIRRKAVVDSGGKNEQVVLLHQNSNPAIIGVANVKVAAAFKNETDLLVGVNVLREEDLQLGLVVGQSRSGKFQLVLVRVAPVGA